jgi:two-component system NtrC family sensor kinase
MKRTLTVIALGLAALALLVGAALKSRSIPLEAHIARDTLNSDIARLSEEFGTLVAALEAARQSAQSPGEAASALKERVVASLAGLEQSIGAIPGSDTQHQRIRNNLARLDQTMTTVDSLTTTLLREQTEYAGNLTLLRDQGPEAARQLTDIGQTTAAANLFQLVAETIDFASSDAPIGAYQIRRILSLLQRDQRIDVVIEPVIAPFLDAIAAIVDSRDNIRSRLNQLAASPLTTNAQSLNLAVGEAYQDAVTGAERARTMLAVYAVVMLIAVGVIGFRLSGSYRALNRANDELGALNETLEHRVQERTKDLSDALYELKESQVQLVQAEKMSSLGQLVAGISHEINTPLLYLANNASLIQERITEIQGFVAKSQAALSVNPSDFDDRADYQASLIQGLKNLKNLLRESELAASVEEIVDLNQDSIEGLADLTEIAQSLKDFSRLDRAPIDRFDVNAGLEKTLTIARSIVKHKAEVRKFYGDLPEIECSPSKINQVFLNLITNAAQAIEDQGDIVISTKLRDEGHVIVSIADTGCGIPEENIDKIRDPFFTTKDVGTGTGLGLSIVDEIVRSHGGELLIQSKPGEGSTFSIVLPIRQPAPDAGTEDDDGLARNLAEAV